MKRFGCSSARNQIKLICIHFHRQYKFISNILTRENGRLKFHFIFIERILSTVPSIPTILHEECSTVNNSVTVAWKATNSLSNDGYVLELDDGSGGEFRVS